MVGSGQVANPPERRGSFRNRVSTGGANQRPIPCRQWTATFLPRSSASVIILKSESASETEAGTPRSGIGKEMKLMFFDSAMTALVSQVEFSRFLLFQQRNHDIQACPAPAAGLILQPVSTAGASSDR